MITNMTLDGSHGLDLRVLQRVFKWQTPLDLISKHDGPFNRWVQAEDDAVIRPPTELTDEFLEQIAKDYLATGRGSPAVLGKKYGASQRTVVRWM